MAVTYSLAAITARMQAVANTIDTGGAGSLRLYASGTLVSTVTLSNPCGTVSGGVLVFSATSPDPSAVGAGAVNEARINNGAGAVVVSGLTVGIPLSGADVIISNGLNSTLIAAGQTVTLLGAQITGS